MGTYKNLWEPVGSCGNLWELVGIHGNLCETCGNSWELVGTCGNLRELVGTHGGTYGNLWEPVRKPVGTCLERVRRDENLREERRERERKYLARIMLCMIL